MHLIIVQHKANSIKEMGDGAFYDSKLSPVIRLKIFDINKKNFQRINKT